MCEIMIMMESSDGMVCIWDADKFSIGAKVICSARFIPGRTDIPEKESRLACSVLIWLRDVMISMIWD